MSSVVDKPLHSGHARVFFNRKVQEVLWMKRRRRWKKKAAPTREFAVPQKKFTMINDQQQWREMRDMRKEDMRI